MSKRSAILFVILVLTIAAAAISTYYFIKTKNNGSPLSYKYTFAFVSQQKNDPYWEEIKKGIEEGANEQNIALQIMEPDWTNQANELDYINMAIMSKVDGIITHSYNMPQFTDIINKAWNAGIPVITVDSDSPSSSRCSFIGIDYNDAGKRAAEVLLQSSPKEAHVAVLSTDTGDETRVKGFIDAVSSNPKVHIDTIETTDSNILSARSKLRSILLKNKDINYVYCTDYTNTIGAAREIIDLNKSEKVEIIGFDCRQENSRNYEMDTYLQNGTIKANIVQTPFTMGKNAVIKMLAYKNGNKKNWLKTNFEFIYIEFSQLMNQGIYFAI
ncbi:MAG: substrate-binding domain-containing protein [Bacillota bacterium]|nr:substrate-binding domain-containing protein [Bacillota bacterium]